MGRKLFYPSPQCAFVNASRSGFGRFLDPSQAVLHVRIELLAKQYQEGRTDLQERIAVPLADRAVNGGWHNHLFLYDPVKRSGAGWDELNREVHSNVKGLKVILAEPSQQPVGFETSRHLGGKVGLETSLKREIAAYYYGRIAR